MHLNNKVRVYDLAKKLNKSNKELLAVLQELGVTVKSHSSSIDEETAQAVENLLAESNPVQKKSPNLLGDFYYLHSSIQTHFFGISQKMTLTISLLFLLFFFRTSIPLSLFLNNFLDSVEKIPDTSGLL